MEPTTDPTTPKTYPISAELLDKTITLLSQLLSPDVFTLLNDVAYRERALRIYGQLSEIPITMP